ncbi:MAG: Mrp/NBP35 family ATP-binding protein [Desulfosarcinaceae bacterium]|nr:Mrp/NBP35 family ATP-binding protein [Desulfosarcinaceae bacterium]
MTNGNITSGGCGGNAQALSAEQDELIRNSLGRIRHKLMVMSGKGGVGKSSMATNLAVAFAERGRQVGLLDVDLHGPSIATMMGIEGLLDITADNQVLPMVHGDGLKVVSMQSLMTDADQAVIWRGPAKTGVIRQFIGNVQWGDLDLLLIDAPPGTGDEPLSVAQTIRGAKALIVTTPQDVALSDVRKSINFCRTINLELVGLVENMGPFACPCCGKSVAPFGSDGGRKTAEQMGVAFLGSLPFDPAVVQAGDAGAPLAGQGRSTAFTQGLAGIVDALTATLKLA